MLWLIILAAAVMLILAVFMTFVLGWANQALHVEVDPKIEKIDEILPGANCGGCGYVGCGEYAEAVVNEGVAPNLCPVGGGDVAQQIAEIACIELDDSVPMRPAVHCMARCNQKIGEHEYRGEATCASADLVPGVQGCAYGCLSLGDCITACQFDAIHMVDGMVKIDYDKCVGCGACEKACPRSVISMIPFPTESMYIVACRNKEKGKNVKSVCDQGCRGCTICQKLSDGLVKMDGNIARIDYEEYDPETVGEAIETVTKKCPSKSVFQQVGKKPDGEKKDEQTTTPTPQEVSQK
jgi:RnfABCDGE-type electron transport complex B subunit